MRLRAIVAMTSGWCLFTSVGMSTLVSGQTPVKLNSTPTPQLEPFIQISPRFFSGARPEDEAGFVAVAALGVKTIVSVDGARPDVESAKARGLRYVHIPFGYDGIDRDAQQLLAQLVRQCEPPFYIHCHHGKHRGPAGAAIACMAAGELSQAAALELMRIAGTDPKYGGLWRAVRTFRRSEDPTPLPELTEVAPTTPLVRAMVQLQRARDGIDRKRAQSESSGDSDQSRSWEELTASLEEGFRESLRATRGDPRGDDFLASMTAAHQSAIAFGRSVPIEGDVAKTLAWDAVSNSCSSCHSDHRD